MTTIRVFEAFAGYGSQLMALKRLEKQNPNFKVIPIGISEIDKHARLGYKCWAKVLNAKDYGIPQNRERIFLVSILDQERKFEFPKPIKLERRLKDVLESNVPERYYLSNKLIDYIYSMGGQNNEFEGAIGVQDGNKTAFAVTANYYKTPRQANYLKESNDEQTSKETIGDKTNQGWAIS